MRNTAVGWVAGTAAVTLFAVVSHAALAVTGTPSVVALATGPGGLKIEAKTSKLVASEAEEKVTVAVDLASLETGIGLRDKHMREKYLEVDKHPRATLTVPRAALKVPASGATGTGKTKGNFSLHGVTRPTDFSYTIVNKGGGYNVLGQLRVHLADHKVEIPSYLGATVGPDVDVTVTFDLAEKK